MNNHADMSLLKKYFFSVLFFYLSGNWVYADELTTVSLQLNWKHQFEFAAFYAAQNQGFYSEVGLEVIIVEGGPGINTVSEVISGKADFGIANSSLLLERAKGKPVVALAALMQHSPISLLAKRELGIENIFDLDGKNLACSSHTCDEILAYLMANGLNKENVHFVPHTGTLLEDLENDDVAATEVYLSNEPFLVRDQEHKYILFTPKSAGIDFFGNILFTSEKDIFSNDTILKNFLEASLKGFKYAMNHPDELANYIFEYKNTQNKTFEHLIYEYKKLNSLTRLDLVEAGYMSVERWKNIADIYRSLGLLNDEVDFEGFLYNLKTTDLPDWVKWSILLLLLLTILIGSALIHVKHINAILSREIEKNLKTEQALRRSQQTYKEFVEHANTLLSHELRTPISVININLDIMQKKIASEPECTTHLNIIRQSVVRLNELFGEKLKSMFSGPSFTTERRQVALHKILLSFLDEFQRLWPDVKINEHLTADVDVYVSTEMLKTAVFNLLENAVKYSIEGTTIDLQSTVNESMALIIVSNISSEKLPDNLDMLFEKNYRSDTSAKISGSGVGLFLVKLIIEAHNGRCEAQLLSEGLFQVVLRLPIYSENKIEL